MKFLLAAIPLTAGCLAQEARIAAGIREQHAGNPDKAIAHYNEALKENPRSAEAHNWLGVALLDKSDLAGAIAEFRKAVEIDPGLARAWTNLGSALGKSGELKESIEAFRKALDLEPDNPAARMNLAIGLRGSGDAKSAAEHIRRVASRQPKDSGVQYELGQALRQGGDLNGAIEAFEAALRINSEMREAYYGLGLTLRQLAAGRHAGTGDLARQELQAGYDLGQKQDLAGALVHLRRAVELGPDSAEAHYNLGAALWYNGSRVQAIAELRESVRLNPAAGEACAFLGMALRETGDLDGARRMLERAVALLPPLAYVYADLGIVFLRSGDLPHALGQFETALNAPAAASPKPAWDVAIAGLAHSSGAEAHNIRGRMMGRNGAGAREVMAEFREAIRLRPDFAEAHNNLGLVLTQEGDDEAAIAAFREALKHAPDYADAHANLGAALTATDSAEAVRELEKAIALDPASVKAQYNLALAYGQSPDGAKKEIELLRRVIAAKPDFVRAHLELGRALLRNSNVAEAVDSLREAVRLDPEMGESHYQLGLALSRAGRHEEAAPELNKGRALVAAKEKPESPGMETIESYIRQGRFREVEPLIAEYLRNRPNSWWGWYALGYSQFGQQKIGDSIQSLSKSLQLNIRNAEAHKILGRDLMIIGRFDAARREFEEGIRLSPRSAEMHYNLGKLFSIQDDWTAARREFEKAVRLEESYAEAWDALGFALEALGDDAGAIADYQKAIQLNNSVSAHVNLSAYYNRTGDAPRALEYAQRALELNARSDRAWFQLAKARERRGELDAAIDSLNRAVGLNPHSSSYYYVLSGLYRRAGKTSESRQALEQFTKLDRQSNELEQKRRDILKEPNTSDKAGGADDRFSSSAPQ